MMVKKTAKKRANQNPGKRVNLYLRKWDETKILELSKYALANGRRISDSLIIRAALELAQADKRFLAAYDEAASYDQRFKTE